MFDSNWDLINGPDAHEIEVLNHANQINVMEALVRLLMHHGPPVDNKGCLLYPNADALRELHRTGTLFLLERPGEWRDVDVHVGKADGTITYRPPPWQEVPAHAAQFVVDLAKMWPEAEATQIAAFCLWKINWIHPFKNGNGRCARAFMYACLCLKYGLMLPGSPTVIDQIMADKAPFEDALKSADVAFATSGTADLAALKTYIESLLAIQLGSIA